MSQEKLKALLVRHEGLRYLPYKCSQGRLTIGVGRNLDDNGISKLEAFVLLQSDINRCYAEARKYPWFDGLSETRRDVVVSMIFNLGFEGFAKFKRLSSALALKNYDLAASEMLSSDWASQVGKRAVELAAMMRTDQYT